MESAVAWREPEVRGVPCGLLAQPGLGRAPSPKCAACRAVSGLSPVYGALSRLPVQCSLHLWPLTCATPSNVRGTFTPLQGDGVGAGCRGERRTGAPAAGGVSDDAQGGRRARLLQPDRPGQARRRRGRAGQGARGRAHGHQLPRAHPPCGASSVSLLPAYTFLRRLTRRVCMGRGASSTAGRRCDPRPPRCRGKPRPH